MIQYVIHVDKMNLETISLLASLGKNGFFGEELFRISSKHLGTDKFSAYKPQMTFVLGDDLPQCYFSIELYHITVEFLDSIHFYSIEFLPTN